MIAQRKNTRKITLGQSFLQGTWTGIAGDHSDKRLSVLNGECVTKSTFNTSARTTGSDRHDGLLGSLLLESFLGAVFAPLLPGLSCGIGITNAVEAIDEIWLERRAVPATGSVPAAWSYAPTTYYPL